MGTVLSIVFGLLIGLAFIILVERIKKAWKRGD